MPLDMFDGPIIKQKLWCSILEYSCWLAIPNILCFLVQKNSHKKHFHTNKIFYLVVTVVTHTHTPHKTEVKKDQNWLDNLQGSAFCEI